jgi:enterochelin esterase-like enzyme
VVYTLHGYGDNLDQLMNVVEPLLEGTPLPEFILVGVSGGNSFYADSAVHGDVARMLVDEVVPVVDERYRTVAKPQGRMLAGFSMGGYVAWTLGLGHADVFASVWASCPGAFDATGVRDALGQWRSGMFYDYAATFAPIFYDTASGKAPLPRFDGTPEDNRYLHDLEKGFGDASKKIAAYQARKPRLAAVRFDYGTDDTFGWIVNGTKALAGQFQAAGIPTTIEGWPANHQITDDMVTAGLFPLIRQVFQGLWSTPAKAAAVGRGDLFYQA